MKTQHLLGMDFSQKQVSGIHLDLPGIETKNPSKSTRDGSFFHHNKPHPHLSQIVTIRTPYTMCIDAKSARCWRYSTEDIRTNFPPGSIFEPHRNAVASGLSFINSLSFINYHSLCTRSERSLPKLTEKKTNITK